ncbi:cobalamin biosynthesis protein CobD [Gottschalkia purinilytica]|uniref:Cobalamin biosynthesis protein CobD n=1 Tax=Gottschalkia purinilytica TaxID=1503 RepID=A0A0L0W8K3_GOTPU|nr:adenosylcobinamide-phosphate synthase CbiB [Gottschalkia purinilytica]KNF07898.1 cobalamin biosynthesis protein CobD [Gottschalkia purinilytica]
MNGISMLIIAVILDFILGDPQNFPHPIRFVGFIIRKYEKLIRSLGMNLKLGGFILTGLTIITTTAIITLILWIGKSINPVVKTILSIYLIYTSLASKCLHKETKKVYDKAVEVDIEESRKMLSYLVGRDTKSLNMDEIIRGAVETVAENTIDGVLAPLFYIGIGTYFGIPVHIAYVYKAINTLDSMVGYTNEKYKDIGFASAKLDDMANYLPARLGSILMVVSGVFFKYDVLNGFKVLFRDRRNHKSPNCGYPESAVAGLLNIQLGGTNTYFGEKIYKPTIGDEVNKLEPKHIIDTIKVMYGSEILTVALIICLLKLI